MSDFMGVVLDLLGQFTGGRDGRDYVVVIYGLAAALWAVMLVLARAKRRVDPQQQHTWMVWAFAIALVRELVMITMVAIQNGKLSQSLEFRAVFPLFEHTFRDVSEILVAAAFLRHLSGNGTLAGRYLAAGVGSIVISYVATSWWWVEHVSSNPTAQFDQTWCDWLFRAVCSFWLGVAVVYLWISQRSTLGRIICLALVCLFLYQFLKIPDMALGGAYEALFTPVRRMLYLMAVGLMTYAYVRQQIAERIQAQAQIFDQRRRTLEQHDFLTGLPNRVLLHDRIRQAITTANRHHKRLALLFLDVDRFKNINDSLGHAVGDELLKGVATRIGEAVRTVDTVCRHGGDEFIILLPEIESANDAAHVAEKLVAASVPAYLADGQELHVTFSIGISICPDDGADIDTLVRCADAAMYHAKASGRNNFQFFTPEMNDRVSERLTVENGLRHALQQGEFTLHYQPKMNLASGVLIGTEALIRWNHPERGLISPAHFVPIAEQSGLIVPIGDWVLNEACRQNRAWQEAGLPAMPVSVNVSAVQLKRKDFPLRLSQILEKTQLDPQYLELELTESIFIQDTEATLAMLTSLKDIGLKLSIDDFGTGYSSLAYIQRFPIDTLKIDQSFVRHVAFNQSHAEIVRAMISMAKSLKQTVIAEGVETADQAAFLKTHQCDEMQGYFLSKPLVAGELERLVRGLAQNRGPITQAQVA